MTQQDQRIAAAELDGWVIAKTVDRASNRYFRRVEDVNESGSKWRRVGDFPKCTPGLDYTDYNTIIPLIQKWCNATPRGWLMFLCELTRRTTPFDEIQTLEKAQGFYNATPYQLRKALLKAAGKWKEDVK